MQTDEETLLLIKRAKEGDGSAKDKLLEENYPLVKSVIRRFKNKGVEYDDLYQLGCMGFVKAITNFCEDRGVKFSTYAVPMIAGEVKRFLRDDGSIKVSRSIKHNSILIKKFIAEYTTKTGEEPSVETIANKLNLEPNDVIMSMESSNCLMSIDDKFDDEDNDTILERLHDPEANQKLIDKIAIRELIKNLSAREKRIIIMRYYFDKTQSEIAKLLGVSQVQISRLENKVLKNFKSKLID